MKRVEKTLIMGCAYTVLILTLFFIYAAVGGLVATAMEMGTFFLILLYGFIISVAEQIYSVLNFNKIVRCIIHYCILLSMFCLVFVLSGNISTGGSGAVFTAIAIFTILYFGIYLIVRFVRKFVSVADEKIDKRAKDGVKKSGKEKKPYTPLYKD